MPPVTRFQRLPQTRIFADPGTSSPQGHYVGRGLLTVLAVIGPSLHKLAPFLQNVAALVGALERVALDMRKAKLDHLARIVGPLSGPSLEGGADAVRGGLGAPAHAA